jgi:hypothetical protein
MRHKLLTDNSCQLEQGISKVWKQALRFLKRIGEDDMVGVVGSA